MVNKLKKHMVLLLLILFYIVELLFLHPIFGINDDWTVYSALSGAYTGTPEAHVLFLTFPVSWLLSALYRIVPELPWYGLFLQGCFMYGFLCLYYRSCRMIENEKRKAAFSLALCVLFLIANLEMLTMIQYTVTAGACGAAAIFMFFTSKDKDADAKGFWKQNTHTFILAFLSLSIRQNAFYLLLPFAGMLWLYRWLASDKPFAMEQLKKYIGFVLILGAVLGTNLGIHQAAYGSGEWKAYARANHAREQIMDFYGWPDYDSNLQLMEEAGISKERYNVMSSAVCFYNGKVPLDQFLQKAAEAAGQHYDGGTGLGERILSGLKITVESLTDKELYPINIMAVLGYIGILASILYHKKRGALAAFGCLLTGRTVSWLIVLYNGRFPLRIPQLLFIMDFMAIMAFFLYFRLYEQQIKKKLVRYAVGAGCLILALYLGVTGLRQVYHKVNDINHYHQDWEGLKDYCEANSQNLYIWSGGSGTLKYFSDGIFDGEASRYQNYFLVSSLYSISPLFRDKIGVDENADIAEELLSRRNACWIFEKGTFSGDNGIVSFYSREYEDFAYKLMDTFTLKNITYEVYQFYVEKE